MGKNKHDKIGFDLRIVCSAAVFMVTASIMSDKRSPLLLPQVPNSTAALACSSEGCWFFPS